MDDFEVKRSFKEIIVEFHSRGVPSAFQRQVAVPVHSKIRKVVVFSGPRRAGKTYLMYCLMRSFLGKGRKIADFLYCNFEDDRIKGIRTGQLRLLLEAFKELYPSSKPVLFLDEVQSAEGWDAFARRLCDSGYEIFVTGSNSKLLSREIATSLRGRSTVVEVFPLSFSEFLAVRGVRLEANWEYGEARHAVRKLFDEYSSSSGFPEVVIEKDLSIVDGYFKTMFYQDILERYKVKNGELVRLLMRYLARNYASDFSIYAFNNFAKSQGLKSSTSVVSKYAGIVSNVYYAFFVSPRHKSFKKQVAYGRKAYAVDHGFINYYNVEKDAGRLLENLVCVEILRRGKEPFFYKDGFECDFVFEDTAVQVSFALGDENKKRETRGLLEAAGKFGCKKLLLLTLDQEKELVVEGLKIQVIPVWKWLLTKDQTAAITRTGFFP